MQIYEQLEFYIQQECEITSFLFIKKVNNVHYLANLHYFLLDHVIKINKLIYLLYSNFMQFTTDMLTLSMTELSYK